MKKRPIGQLIATGIMLLTAVALIAVGAFGYISRSSDKVRTDLDAMRSYAVLHSSVDALIKEYVVNAKREAKAYSEEQGMTRNQSKEYMEQTAERAQTEAEEKYASFAGMDLSPLDPKIEAVSQAQQSYHALEREERAAYKELYARIGKQAEEYRGELWDVMDAGYAAAAQETEEGATVNYTYKVEDFLAEGSLPGAKSAMDALDEQGQKIFTACLKTQASSILDEITGADSGVSEDSEEGDTTDYKFFEPSAELSARKEAITPVFDELWTAASALIPELNDDLKDDAGESMLAMIDTDGMSYEQIYDSYLAADAKKALTGSDRSLRLARNGNMLFLLGAEALLLALVVFFYSFLTGRLGVPRLILLTFFLTLCVISSLLGINVPYMLGNILKRTGMFGVLALAMLPGIQCGIGLNLGMTVGCIGGLLSTMIVLENRMTGVPALLMAIAGGILIAIPLGWGYSKLLNCVKGDEMTISNYVGFSFVSLMCIAWMVLPFKNPKLTWILGSGLRVTHNLTSSFGGILNNFLSFKLFGATVPTGLLLFLLLSCFLMWLFLRSRTGTAMIAAGSNPRFAEAAGVNVNRMRVIGTILSTVIASVGIIVYAQSLGYAQLYNSPKQMGFISASAILIGGASVTRGKVSHVIIGTFLFQGVLALGLQVANAALSGGGLSEITRIMISNGIILYALTQSGGDSRA